MRMLLTLTILLTSSAAAQDYRNWDSLGRLKPGDRVRITLERHGPVTAEFRSFTADELTAGALAARKPDVVAVERYRGGRWSRGKRAAVAAAISFGGGFAVGAAAGGCSRDEWFCIGRGPSGLILGGVGAVLGGAVGALLPNRSTETIYSVS